MVRLGLSINEVAFLRNMKGEVDTPDPVHVALMGELGGVDSIDCHLREDRSHVKDRDVKLLRETLQSNLNLWMAALPEMVKTALETRPESVTFVAERPNEPLQMGGIDLATQGDSVGKAIALLRESGIFVNVLIEPNPDTVKLAHRVGAQGVVLSTERFATGSKRKDDRERELEKLRNAGQFVHKLRLSLALSGGIHYRNIVELLTLPNVEKVHIGHSVMERALFMGLGAAVKEMRDLLN